MFLIIISLAACSMDSTETCPEDTSVASLEDPPELLDCDLSGDPTHCICAETLKDIRDSMAVCDRVNAAQYETPITDCNYPSYMDLGSANFGEGDLTCVALALRYDCSLDLNDTIETIHKSGHICPWL